MFQRDYLMRQIQQMMQVITQVLFHRRNDRPDEALEIIDTAFSDLPALEKLLRPGLSRDEVLETCGGATGLNSDYAVVVADVLRERGSILSEDGSRGRTWLRYALWLYEAALAEGGSAVPWNVHEQMAQLKEMIGEELDEH
jgi:hypothetical protein